MLAKLGLCFHQIIIEQNIADKFYIDLQKIPYHLGQEYLIQYF